MYRYRNAVKASVLKSVWVWGGYLCYNIVKEYGRPIVVKDLHCSQFRVQIKSSPSTDFIGLTAVY